MGIVPIISFAADICLGTRCCTQVDVTYKTKFGNNCLHYLHERIKKDRNRLDEQAKWFEILRYICAHGGEGLKQMANRHGQVR